MDSRPRLREGRLCAGMTNSGKEAILIVLELTTSDKRN